MADLETPPPEKKPQIEKARKTTVDEFLMSKPPLGETSRNSFRQRSIGCNDLEKLYKEYR
jgi:hypothetical protein